MTAYGDFAYFYDLFMDDIPYDKWEKNILSLLEKNGVKKGIICDLGCGTGEMTMRLYKRGFDMIGLDLSEEMLMEARDKMYDEEISDILYINQDMRAFELFGTVDAFVSVCDSLNYILEYDDLYAVLSKCNNYLEKGGPVIFDLKTELLYKTKMSDKEFFEEKENATLTWKNDYNEQLKINKYSIVIDAYDEENPDVYDEISEEHFQRAWTAEEVKSAILEAGMEFVGFYDADTMEELGDSFKDANRVYVVAREGFQENKFYG